MIHAGLMTIFVSRYSLKVLAKVLVVIVSLRIFFLDLDYFGLLLTHVPRFGKDFPSLPL